MHFIEEIFDLNFIQEVQNYYEIGKHTLRTTYL